MRLGDKIREFRETIGLTQGQLAGSATVSQGYLSQLENGDVRNPSAAILLRLAQAMHVNPDDLFEAAGYPTTRTLRQIYQNYEANIDPDLLRYLGRLPRDRQRRLLFLLEGMENLVEGLETASPPQIEDEQNGHVEEERYREDVSITRLQG